MMIENQTVVWLCDGVKGRDWQEELLGEGWKCYTSYFGGDLPKFIELNYVIVLLYLNYHLRTT